MKKNSAKVITQILIKEALFAIQKKNKNSPVGQVGAISCRSVKKGNAALFATSELTLTSLRSTTKQLFFVCKLTSLASLFHHNSSIILYIFINAFLFFNLI